VEPECLPGFEKLKGKCYQTCDKYSIGYGSVCVKTCPTGYQCGVACVKDASYCNDEMKSYLTTKLGLLESTVSSNVFKNDFNSIIKTSLPDVRRCP
jgi:hypothetical protein